MVQMYGQPYNQNTLKPVPPDETARLHRVREQQSFIVFGCSIEIFFPVPNFIFIHIKILLIELLSLQELWSFSGIIPSTTPSET